MERTVRDANNRTQDQPVGYRWLIRRRPKKGESEAGPGRQLRLPKSGEMTFFKIV
jgi:hypothetical protein